MNRNLRTLLAFISLGTGLPVNAQPVSNLVFAANPTVQCIYHALKSSSAVQSVSLYSADVSRFFIEYAFRNKEGQIVSSDIELFMGGDAVMRGDMIPREVSMETANEAHELEEKLDLTSNCRFQYSFDNVVPGPGARADWQKISWPNE